MYSLPQSYNQTSKCKRCISSNAYANSIKNEDSFLFPDDQLCILWEIPDTGSRKAIETGDVWTAQQTYEWLQKLLQQFTDESPDADQAVPGKQRFFRKMLDFFFK